MSKEVSGLFEVSIDDDDEKNDANHNKIELLIEIGTKLKYKTRGAKTKSLKRLKSSTFKKNEDENEEDSYEFRVDKTGFFAFFY